MSHRCPQPLTCTALGEVTHGEAMTLYRRRGGTASRPACRSRGGLSCSPFVQRYGTGEGV